jgi:hypothetical protein
VKKWASELNRAFSKEEVQCPTSITSLAIKEMKIKIRLRFHLTPDRKAIIKNTKNNKCWQGCGEKGTLIHCWWECKLVHHYGGSLDQEELT